MDQEPRAVVCRAATYRRCGQERIRVKKKIQRFMLVARILEKWKMSKKKKSFGRYIHMIHELYQLVLSCAQVAGSVWATMGRRKLGPTRIVA
jgi:hypothetical protein